MRGVCDRPQGTSAAASESSRQPTVRYAAPQRQASPSAAANKVFAARREPARVSSAPSADARANKSDAGADNFSVYRKIRARGTAPKTTRSMPSASPAEERAKRAAPATSSLPRRPVQSAAAAKSNAGAPRTTVSAKAVVPVAKYS